MRICWQIPESRGPWQRSTYRPRDDEHGGQATRVEPREGDFYGGWITSRVSGPFKGAPGTRGW
jgi:hypothetical protein